MEFQAFPKMPRLFSDIIITEKIDGTNACIAISEEEEMTVQSRKKIITLDSDNYGFARWAEEHKDELIAGLGPGYHFGEWWGSGIQRRYGLDHKRFSLFNVHRWRDGSDDVRPECCHVVPVLFEGDFSEAKILSVEDMLIDTGSYAAPGFMNPEGMVIFFKKYNCLFKYPFAK